MKSQELKLAFKALVLSITAYFARSGSDFAITALIALALWFYFRPAVNLGRFWFSYGVNLGFLFFAPWDPYNLRSRLFVVIGFGLVSGLILGAKNMVFMRRLSSYQIAICLLLGELVFFFFSGVLGSYATLISAAGLILLTKEYYAVAVNRPMMLYSMVSALVYMQFLWAISVLPLESSGKIALALTLILLMNDIFAHRLGNNLTPRIIWRNSIVALVSSVLIINLSAGPLS